MRIKYILYNRHNIYHISSFCYIQLVYSTMEIGNLGIKKPFATPITSNTTISSCFKGNRLNVMKIDSNIIFRWHIMELHY